MRINTLDGSKTATVVARYTLQAEFTVGGVDDEDRIDSVKEMFDDHYDDIVENPFLGDSITSMNVNSIVVKNDNSSSCIAGNVYQMFANLLDSAISEARFISDTEHILAKESEDSENAEMHENNVKELNNYVEFLEDIKARYAN
jgi:hypothetical protein